MEKKHKPKSATYHSTKILGQLYDKVETVDFKPQWEGPFDKRILRAYKLDDGVLKTARQIKSKYDTAMKRLMAQQEIATEFEIWSTFVLSRPRVGSDYKIQEEIARLSDALKDQFRAECIEKAGSKEFLVLGPFAAAMYKITKEELDIALAECRATRLVSGLEVPVRKMEPKSMPLISFPWLFEKELGRIATGFDISEELDDLGLTPLVLKEPGTRKYNGGAKAEDDYIVREDGVLIHRGEELDLFHEMSDTENDADESDFDEGRSRAWDDHETTMGRDGEQVLATEFEIPQQPVPDYIRQGTGVEDVVPQVTLDGLIDPRETARRAHDYDHPDRASYFGDLHNLTQDKTDVKRTSSGDSNANLLTLENSLSSDDENRTVTALDDLAELETDSAEEVEEEVVELEVEESSLEKLAKLITDQSSPENSGGVEEEKVIVRVKESSLDQLASMMDS